MQYAFPPANKLSAIALALGLRFAWADDQISIEAMHTSGHSTYYINHPASWYRNNERSRVKGYRYDDGLRSTEAGLRLRYTSRFEA
jgi:hypothetical protein